jgi:hypothetical protein
MMESTRARVATIVGAVRKGMPVCPIRDFSNIDFGTASASIINVLIAGKDFAAEGQFPGNCNFENLDFYDYETLKPVQLEFDGSNFLGFDHHSGRNFSGFITGVSIVLYDYETARNYNFRTPDFRAEETRQREV